MFPLSCRNASRIEKMSSDRIQQKKKINVIFGENFFLREKAEKNITQQYHIVTRIDPQNLTEHEFSSICSQRELFQTSVPLYILPSADELRGLWKILQTMKKNICNDLLFIYKKKSLSQGLQKIIREMQTQVIPCPDPRPHAYPALVAEMCKQHGLHLDAAGRQSLLTASGSSSAGGYRLKELDNEIKKLFLIFGERKITAADIAPHLGLLREDSTFHILDLLLKRQYTQVQLVVENLLRSGESPLALLGVIAYFLRNILQSKEGKLSPYLQTKYEQYVREDKDKSYSALLAVCQQADVSLKTSGIKPDLIIFDVISALQER